MSPTCLEWIESAGGPLVVVPALQVGRWMGVDGVDYDEACSVADYLGKLKRSWGDVIVLNDEPLRTAVLALRDGPAIVRWIHAPDETHLISFAQNTEPDESSLVESLEVNIADGVYAIFDGASQGATAAKLTIAFPIGRRVVRTYLMRDKSGEVAILLHSLR
jgi:hypothetical protein